MTVYDFGEDEGVLYLTMEFLEGRTLHDLMEEQPIFTIDSILPIFEQITSALHYAHSRHIIHRDIKPANIMVLENRVVKVTDFGIAKIMSGGMTQTGGILGTPNYMSPEQVTGRPVDGRADIFSLGVILYELVTGTKPFGGDNITTVIYRIVHENPVPPRELDASIHPGVARIISKALNKNPAERYANCLELMEELRHFRALGSSVPAFATVPISVPAAVAAGTPKPLLETPPTSPPKPPLDVPLTPRPVMAPSPERHTSRSLSVLAALLLICVFGAGAYYLAPKLRPWLAALGMVHSTSRPVAVRASRVVPARPTMPAAPVITPPPASPSSASSAAKSPRSRVPAAVAPAAKIEPERTHRPAERASETPKPADVGTLRVTSNVVGASITLDDQTRPEWVTPYSFTNLAPGSHDVMVAKDGYEGVARRITVVAGRSRTLNLDLAAPTGVFKLMTNPPGADVRIDGKDYGPSPVRAVLPAGRHTYVLKQGRIASPTHEFVIRSGSYVTQTVSLTRARAPTGTVSIRTIPPGATIIVDGVAVGRLTPTRITLRVGSHILIVSKAGYQPFRDEVDIQRGQSVPVEVLLRGLAP